MAESRYLPARHLLQHPRELRRAREERPACRRGGRRTLHTHETRQPVSRVSHRLLSARGRHFPARRVTRGLLLATLEGIAQAAMVARSVFSGVAADVPGREGLARLEWHVPESCRRSVQVVAHGVSWQVLLHRPSSVTRGERLSCIAARVGGDFDRRSLWGGLHDPSCSWQRKQDRTDEAVLPAEFSRHLLRGAHAVPGLRSEQRRIQGHGVGVYGQPRFADTVATMVRFENGRLRNDNSWFAFHTGSALCYSPRFIEAFGAPCRGEGDVDAEPYRDVAASGQRVLEDRTARHGKLGQAGTGEERSVPGRWRGAECRRQRPHSRAADLQKHLGPTGRERCRVCAWHSISHLARTAGQPAPLRDGACGTGDLDTPSRRCIDAIRSHGSDVPPRGRCGARDCAAVVRGPSDWVVSGPDGVGAACAWQPQHPRRSSPRGHEGHHQPQDQVSRALPSVRAIGARGRRRGLLSLPRSVAVHDVRLPGSR